MAGGPFETSRPSPGTVILRERIGLHPERGPFSAGGLVLDGDLHKKALSPSSTSPGLRTDPASASSLAIRSRGVKLHHRGLDPELRFEITFRRIGAGLANLGNTCYLNSVLQCLTYTEPFAAYLHSGKHKSSCRTAGFCALCALQNHVMDALRSTGKILRPFHLVKNLRCISRNFRNSRQEDAHEYMVNLLESMHKCCLPSGIASESSSAYEKSLVHKIFGGRLRSQVKCLQCLYCSNKFDPFLDLSLEIMKADTLHKALTDFTAVEQLDGGERQYQCQRCKQKVRAVKQLTIHKAPYVLTVHLKRFGSILSGQKINKKVDFEPALDLRQYVSDPSERDLKYTLYGVLVHAGYATHSGHYYCFVRTSSGAWYSLNDDEVFQVSEKIVLQQKAYMLFYVRNLSSFPKGSPDIVCKEKHLADVSSCKESLHVYSLTSKRESQDSPVQCRPMKAIKDSQRENGHRGCITIQKTGGFGPMPMPVKSIAAEHSLKKSSFPMHNLAENTQISAPSEDSTLQSIPNVSSVKDASSATLLPSATDKHLVGDNLNKLHGNGILQSFLFKEKSVLPVTHVFRQTAKSSEDIVPSNPIVDSATQDIVATCTLVKDLISAHLDGKSGSTRVGDSAVSETKSNKLAVSHDKVNGSLKRGLQKVPIKRTTNEKLDTQKLKVHVDGRLCETKGFLQHEQATFSNRLNAMSSECMGIAQVQCQDAADKIANEAATEGPKIIPKESGQVIPTGSHLNTLCYSSQREYERNNVFNKPIMKIKVRKHAHLRNVKFGPVRLSSAYLNVVRKNVRKKKHHKMKRQHLNCENKQIYETSQDNVLRDQGTSTSNRVNAIEAEFIRMRRNNHSQRGTGVVNADLHPTKKSCCDCSGRINGEYVLRGSKIINNGSFNATYCGKRQGMSGDKVKLEGQHSARKTCHQNSSHHHDPKTLYTKSSAEMTTAQWNKRGSVSEFASTSDNGAKNVRYVPSEKEKECNHRKKLKRSRKLFGGQHFLATAVAGAGKKMKMDRSSTRNGPLRIRSQE